MSDARIVVWDPDTAESIEEVELQIHPTLRDGVNDAIVFYLSQGSPVAPDDLVVPQEWVGRKLFIEVNPSAVTHTPMLSAVEQAAKKLGVRVG